MKDQKIKILNDVEHILIRSSMYLGSTTYEDKNIFLDYKFQSVKYSPGLFKIVNELIDNSCDEYGRTDGKFANKLIITMDHETFSVQDNGRGIPVTKIQDIDGSMIYQPEAAWCRVKAGANFEDDSTRQLAGTFGVGGSVSNIFAKSFIGETCDGKKKFVIHCKDNAQIVSSKITTSTTRYTKVTMTPDFARFNVENFDDTIIGMVEDRLRGLLLTFPRMKITFNGNPVQVGNAKEYINHFGENPVIFQDDKVIIGFMSSPDGEIRNQSIVNGLTIYNGGSHIDYVMNSIVSTLRDAIKRKHKFDISPSQIKAHIQTVSIMRRFNNPKFDSQTKERLTNTHSEVAEYLSYINYELIAKQIIRNDTIIQPIIEKQLARQALEEARKAKEGKKKLRGIKIARHIAATSKNPEEKVIFFVEGNSAGGPFVLVRDSKTQGMLPLRGKILNTFDKKPSTILSNTILGEIMVVVGLELGKPVTRLNYGTIAIMTDQDVDGGAIKAQLINFFYLWPELFEEHRVKILISPKYILRGKKDRYYFYSKEELDRFGNYDSKYELVYIKGLGTLRKEEYRDIINDPHYQTVDIDDPSLFNMMYGPDPELRKNFMME